MSSLPIGQTFGRLSFLGVSDQRGPGGRQMWRMACACGSAVVLAANKVKTGNTKSCGCLRSAPDLSGLRFGVLAVLGDAARGADGRHRVRCRCDCGAEVVVAPSDLRKSRGATVSCGCFRATFGRSNAADLSGRVFGRLTAGAPASSDRRGVVWSCTCACGAATTALASDLIGGRKVSCGCAVVDKPGLTPAGLNARRVAGGHRRRALKRNAGGSFTAAQIDALYRAQRGRCACCGVALRGKFHRDHRVALANGGSNDITNIELLCGPCNLSKGAKDEIAWANENGRLL